MSTTKQRAVVYARISKDPEEQKVGVGRQVERGIQIAADRGYRLVGKPIEDNDKSAFISAEDETKGRGDTRPGFAQLRQLIESRAVDVAIAQHQDRFARNRDTWSDLIKLAAIRGVRLETWAGPIDIESATGFLTNGMQALVDHHYSLVISEKARDAHRKLVEGGMPNGGRRPFGFRDRFTADGTRKRTTEVEPAEAELIRQAATDLLAGSSMRSIVIDWNERGLRTTTGRPWQDKVLHRTLINPRLAGLRTYKGKVVGEAAWPAIIPRPEWEQLRALLTSRSRPGDPKTLKYWLVGLAHCGRCGHRLTSYVDGNGYRCYRCPPSTAGGCGGIRVAADPLEDLAAAKVVARLELHRSELLAGADQGNEVLEATAALIELEERERLVGEGLATEAITMAIARTASASIEAERERLRQVITEHASAGTIDIPDNLVDLWPALTPDEKRRLATVAIDRVVLDRATRQGRGFDPARVRVEWALDVGAADVA